MEGLAETLSYTIYKYILFSGSAFPFAETETLQLMVNYLQKKKYNNIKIIYRPHPKLNWRKWYYKENYKNVLIENVDITPVDIKTEQMFIKNGDLLTFMKWLYTNYSNASK